MQEGASFNKITSDAVVDVAISGGSIWGSGVAGSAVGVKVGSMYPGIGNIAGAVVGFAVGAVAYFITDGIKIKGKTIREYIKDGFNWLNNWG